MLIGRAALARRVAQPAGSYTVMSASAPVPRLVFASA